MSKIIGLTLKTRLATLRAFKNTLKAYKTMSGVPSKSELLTFNYVSFLECQLICV